MSNELKASTNTSVPVTKQSSAGLKYDAGKPSMSLIDREALIQLANVLDYGARKYSAHNWRKGIQWSRTIDAAIRHLVAFNDGEDMDPETGLNHIAHAMCNCMFLLNFYVNHKELDDRHCSTTIADNLKQYVGPVAQTSSQNPAVGLQGNHTALGVLARSIL